MLNLEIIILYEGLFPLTSDLNLITKNLVLQSPNTFIIDNDGVE